MQLATQLEKNLIITLNVVSRIMDVNIQKEN